MPSSNVQQRAQEYFSSLNPLATKIYSDIHEIADAYSHLWTQFSADEQHDVINVTLIKPDIVLKYLNDISKQRKTKAENEDNLSLSSLDSSSYQDSFDHIYLYNGKDLCTYSQMITALKYTQDDVSGAYRDEHSEPFNSKTKSQINLNLLANADVKRKIQSSQKKFAASDLFAKKPNNDHVLELQSKFANAKSESNEDSRKSFMSKLFCGKSNALALDVPSPKSNGDVSSVADDTRDVNVRLVEDFDSMSTRSASSLDKKEPSDISRLIEKDDDNLAQKGYDFLNNW